MCRLQIWPTCLPRENWKMRMMWTTLISCQTNSVMSHQGDLPDSPECLPWSTEIHLFREFHLLVSVRKLNLAITNSMITTCSSVRNFSASTSRQIQNWSRNIPWSATILWKGGSLKQIIMVIAFSSVRDKLYSTKTIPRYRTKGRRCKWTRCSMTFMKGVVMYLQLAPCTDILKCNSEDKLLGFAEDLKTTLWCMVATSLECHTIILTCTMTVFQNTPICKVNSKEAISQILMVPFQEWRVVTMVCTSQCPLSVNVPLKSSRRPNKRISTTYSLVEKYPPMILIWQPLPLWRANLLCLPKVLSKRWPNNSSRLKWHSHNKIILSRYLLKPQLKWQMVLQFPQGQPQDLLVSITESSKDVVERGSETIFTSPRVRKRSRKSSTSSKMPKETICQSRSAKDLETKSPLRDPGWRKRKRTFSSIEWSVKKTKSSLALSILWLAGFKVTSLNK